MAGFLPLPENSKKYFNPDKPSRDQGKYYLKLLQFSTGKVFVFCCLQCMTKQRRHLELRMKIHFNDKAAHSFILNFLILNAISILPPLRRAPALVFLINTGVQKPARGSETRTVLEKWATFRLNMRQRRWLVWAAGAPPAASQTFLSPPPRPPGTQICALFILPLVPRAHTLKYVDRWMDTAMQIVSSWLQNVRGNHIFPSFPSGILNTQNQVNFSISTEVSNLSTLQVSLNSQRRRY